jgi:multiple sugar transport system ATP-binding protein
MSMGVLQQVDRPQHLYDEPFNLFVAGFIGTPPMNLFEGTVHSTGGSVSVTIGSATLPVGEVCVRRYPAVQGFDSREVVVGVRSEDVHPASARTDLPTIDARVDLVEALGSGQMAYLHIDATRVRPAGTDEAEALEAPEAGGEEEGVATARPNLIAHFPPRVDLRIADTIPVAIDIAGLHFFDPETGAALR